MFFDPNARARPNKALGMVYILFGIFALGVSAWVFVVQGSFWNIQPAFRIIFGSLILIYGLYRIYSGFDTFRKSAIEDRAEAAKKAEDSKA